ncbi:hypothetical protein C8T65DRAFT_196994 [Cerioporus squamosus]|nr:hypothetical protein C8T65DRAFT_196994 [Cerioporus squamosus]
MRLLIFRFPSSPVPDPHCLPSKRILTIPLPCIIHPYPVLHMHTAPCRTCSSLHPPTPCLPSLTGPLPGSPAVRLQDLDYPAPPHTISAPACRNTNTLRTDIPHPDCPSRSLSCARPPTASPPSLSSMFTFCPAVGRACE